MQVAAYDLVCKVRTRENVCVHQRHDLGISKPACGNVIAPAAIEASRVIEKFVPNIVLEARQELQGPWLLVLLDKQHVKQVAVVLVDPSQEKLQIADPLQFVLLEANAYYQAGKFVGGTVLGHG